MVVRDRLKKNSARLCVYCAVSQEPSVVLQKGRKKPQNAFEILILSSKRETGIGKIIADKSGRRDKP